jgi:glycosyltransferase involved in cell wall biosynthesis
MRVLHLISNFKYTGPVDPALNLARALGDLGVDSRVAVGRSPPRARDVLPEILRERRIPAVDGFSLSKHRSLFADRRDVRRLLEVLAREPYDILHAHLDNAHDIAQRARRFLRARAARAGARQGAAGGFPLPVIVRSLYDDHAPPSTPRYRRLLGSGADGVFVFGSEVAREVRRSFAPAGGPSGVGGAAVEGAAGEGAAGERVIQLEGAISIERFRPRPPGEDLRERFGIPRRAIVVGIVARIQRHRRYDLLLGAVRRLAGELPDLYLLVLGRGTHAQELAHERARELGIGARVILPGYVGGEDYAAALACFDMKVFLVPGSDGTCRALREAMAMGIAPVVSRRGLLPEVVRHEVDGLVVDETEEQLAAAIRTLALDPALRRRLGESALRRARESFPIEKQAAAVLAAYRRWLDGAR